MEKVLDIEQILRRFAQAKGIDFNKAEIGRILGVGRANVGNWITAGNMGTGWAPFLTACEGLDLSEIIHGQKSASPPTIEQALRVITDAGYSVRKGE